MVWSTRGTTRRGGAAPSALARLALWASALVAIALVVAQFAWTPPTRHVAPQSSADLRLVSLSPAITRTLVALGLGDRVVGRTPWCDSVPAEVPVVGSLQDFDAERLVALRPTHLLVQPPAAGVDPGLQALADANGWRIVAFPLTGLDDIEAMLLKLPAALAPDGSASRAELEANASRLRDEMASALAAMALDHPAIKGAGRVLWLFSIDPPMAFGRGSYLDDVATRLGVANAIDVAGYPELSLEDVHRANPDSIVLVRESREGLAAKEAAVATLFGALDVSASRNRQVLVFADPNAMTPGAGVIDLARALRAFLEAHAWSGSPAPAVEADP